MKKKCDCCEEDHCPTCGGKVCPDCGKAMPEQQYIPYYPNYTPVYPYYHPWGYWNTWNPVVAGGVTWCGTALNTTFSLS